MASILITGASRGIGRELARQLHHRGHRVVATARRLADLDGVPAQTRLALDVTDGASVTAAIENAGDIDIIISNAGGVFFAAVEAIPPERMLALLDQNTVGSLRLVQAVLPQMRRRGSGVLLFMSSVIGRTTARLNGAYAASKWALEALVETLSDEVSGMGIRVTLIEPSSVASTANAKAQTFTLKPDPYGGQTAPAAGDLLEPAAVAAAVADAIDTGHYPLRLTIGHTAAELVKRRAAADLAETDNR